MFIIENKNMKVTCSSFDIAWSFFKVMSDKEPGTKISHPRTGCSYGRKI